MTSNQFPTQKELMVVAAKATRKALNIGFDLWRIPLQLVGVPGRPFGPERKSSLDHRNAQARRDLTERAYRGEASDEEIERICADPDAMSDVVRNLLLRQRDDPSTQPYLAEQAPEKNINKP